MKIKNKNWEWNDYQTTPKLFSKFFLFYTNDIIKKGESNLGPRVHT